MSQQHTTLPGGAKLCLEGTGEDQLFHFTITELVVKTDLRGLSYAVGYPVYLVRGSERLDARDRENMKDEVVGVLPMEVTLQFDELRTCLGHFQRFINEGIWGDELWKTRLILYRAYLLSDVWKSRRARVLERDRYTCTACLAAPATQVHHLTYDRIAKEPLFDLASICDACHKSVHNKEASK